MLEDKAESDKAPKTGLTSPQSSILDFFISPNKGKPSKKPTETSEDLYSGIAEIQKKGETVNPERQVHGKDNQELCVIQDESADSVILLSDETSQHFDGHATEVDELNVSGVSNRKKLTKKDPDILKPEESCLPDSADSQNSVESKCSSKSRKQKTLTKTQSTKETKSENLQEDIMTNAVNNVTESATVSDVETSKDDEMKKDQPGKKKRKRKSSENVDRKRSKTDPNLEEVSVDQNCSATEMSYEAFIQSISTPGRDPVDNTSPDKSSDARENEEPEILEVKKTFTLSEAIPDQNLVHSKKKTKTKSARASLFSEDYMQTKISGVEDVSVSGDENEEKGKEPTILNFFSRVNSSENLDKEHQIVTVLADVHHHPCKEMRSLQTCSDVDTSTPLKSQGPRVLSPKSSGVAEMEEGIEILGSETVVEVPNKKKSSKSKKKEKDKSVNEKADDLNVKDDESKDDVKIEKVEVAPRTTEVDAFLKSSDSPTVPVKSAQATLSFTKGGLKATTVVTTHNTRVRSETDAKPAEESGTKKDIKKGKNKKSGKAMKTVNRENSEKEISISVVSDDDEESPQQERKSRRVKYQVSSLQFDDSRQTPIKMKIRLKKNSSGEESDFTPKSSKVKGQRQQKAQKLLEKAKKVKKSKTSKQKSQGKKRVEVSKDGDESVVDLDSSTDGGGRRRRSARLAIHSPPPDPIVVDDEEEAEPEKKAPIKSKKGTNKTVKTPLKLKPKDSPRKLKAKNSPLKLAKDSPRKAKNSPRKQKGNKLAPIFMGKSKTEPEKLKEPEDPEKVRLRQAFLMSDVPESLKRKVVATATIQNVWENVGLPTISHIQQKPHTQEDNSMWNLPPVELPLREWKPFQTSQNQWKDMTCHRVISLSKTDLFKDFHSHPEFSLPVVEELLGELESRAKSLPVRQMYMDMQQKLRDDLRSQNDSADTADKQDADAKPVQEDRDKKKKGPGRGKAAAEKGEKGKKKLSLRKSVEEMEVTESIPALDMKKGGEMMWSERYQPTHSSEVIGHTGHIQKLKSWLLEWKHRTHKEARKMRLQMLKQSHPKSTAKDDHADNAWWGEDDSDFDLDSEDSEEEDDSLCNTMLITGPHGVGKTATVYALAQELGYKVIEVNAASSRNGKKILSKLQEATQSHQVAASKDGGSSNMLAALSNSMSNSGMALDSPKPAKKEAKLPTAFTNLFRKAGRDKPQPVEVIDLDADDKKKKKGSPVKSKRKRKREKEDVKAENSPKKARKEKSKTLPQPVRDDSSQSGGLELSSTTLILFDEVEIFFEDDRGYLPAIQHFMTRTKIPIILTTTETNFGGQLQARCESLIFKQPSLITIASHLQTICLVENVRTCPEEMLSLVRFHRGDIRKCLLWLQYWLSSGGGTTRINRDVKVAPRPVLLSIDENTCSQDSIADTREKTDVANQDDDDDFVMSKASVSRKRRVLVDDESSNSNVFPMEISSSQSSSSKSSHLPQVHCLKLEAIAGISQPVQEVLEKVLRSYLKGDCDHQKAQELQELCENLHVIGLSVLSKNLLHLLPLPKLPLHIASSQTSKQETKQTKRSRIHTDLFDDEASNDSAPETVEKKLETEIQSSDSKNDRFLSYKCLKAFSQYYDSVCSLDVVGTRAEQCLSSKCYLSPLAITDFKTGSSEGERRVDHMSQDPDSTVMSLVKESRVLVGMRSARQLYGSITEAVDCYKSETGHGDLPEAVSLSVSGGRTTFSLMSSEARLPGAVRKAHENVSDCLPLTNHCSQRLVHMDYLPSLRAISRAEQHRQIAKTHRRFHHYFDHIGLPLKESSLNVLCQTFN